ncbi:MAG: hypothetical protein IIC87_03645 [Chloroflexi bacterium]|nr:hypothetical protein [Chloroflexota bacterium]
MEKSFGTVIKDREGRRVVEISKGSDSNFKPVIFLEFDNGQALFFYPAKAKEFAKELSAIADRCERGH